MAQNEQSRLEAIKEVYGIETKTITMSDGEVISNWYMLGYETIEEVLDLIPEEEIEDVYDSNGLDGIDWAIGSL
jgi:Mg/Co/Ni transporter MgtE